MGNWSLTGILLMTSLFMIMTAFILSQIGIESPLGTQSNVLLVIIDWIVP